MYILWKVAAETAHMAPVSKENRTGGAPRTMPKVAPKGRAQAPVCLLSATVGKECRAWRASGHAYLQ